MALCGYVDKMSQLRQGMIKEDALAILGNPDGLKTYENYEAIQYTNRYMSCWDNAGQADYYVVFKDRQVIEYGVGTVRPPKQVDGGGILFIYPIQ
jgi:GTPase SAR1 family protein